MYSVKIKVYICNTHPYFCITSMPYISFVLR